MLTGYSVLITGAWEGLGRGLALAAGAAGAGVVVSALEKDRADDVVQEIRSRGGRAVGVACDVTQRADIAAAVAVARAEFGCLDAFVHNANDPGSGARAVEAIGDADWDVPVAVGLRPVFFAAHEVLPALIETQGTMIVMTSPAGIDGTARGRDAAALEARGAAFGTIGLAAFAAIVWRVLPDHPAPAVLVAAAAVWLAVSVVLWRLRQVLR